MSQFILGIAVTISIEVLVVVVLIDLCDRKDDEDGNTGMYLKLKNNGAVFKFTNGTSVFVKKKGDRYEIKKKRSGKHD